MKGKKAEYCVTYLNPGAVETQAGRFLLSLKPAWSTQSSRTARATRPQATTNLDMAQAGMKNLLSLQRTLFGFQDSLGS